MGLLTRLLGQPQNTEQMQETRRLSIVGESFYQPALASISDAKDSEDVSHDCFAELIPEPTNDHDPNAIMVCIEGQRVGYLSRSNAKRYRAAIVAMVEADQPTICKAFIGRRADDENPNIGVSLDVPLSHPEP